MSSELPLPNRIRALRDTRHMSVRDLAEKSGIDQSTINRMERGAQPLDYPRGKRIAAALGVRFSAILNDDDVEMRADDAGNAILAELENIPPHEKASVIAMATALVRIVRVTAARHNAGALGGDPEQITELADLWNKYDANGRARVLSILHAAADKAA